MQVDQQYRLEKANVVAVAQKSQQQRMAR